MNAVTLRVELTIFGTVNSAVVLAGLLARLEDGKSSLEPRDELAWLERIEATEDLTLVRYGMDAYKAVDLTDFCTENSLSWRLMTGEGSGHDLVYNTLQTWMPGFKKVEEFPIVNGSEPSVSLIALQNARRVGLDMVDKLLTEFDHLTQYGVNRALKVDPDLIATFKEDMALQGFGMQNSLHP